MAPILFDWFDGDILHNSVTSILTLHYALIYAATDVFFSVSKDVLAICHVMGRSLRIFLKRLVNLTYI
jgi:hypothetical protein